MNKTIILSPRFSSDSQDIWRAAVKQNWNIHRAINYSVPEDVSDCCVYGEISFCDSMAERCGLSLLDPVNTFLSNLPFNLVKRDITYCEARDLQFYFSQYDTNKVFVKPANDKVFQYGVYYKYTDIPLSWVSMDCPVILSNVVDWETEVRLYCLDGNVLTSASYRFIGDRDEDVELREAEDFGSVVLNRYGDYLPSAVVLDVGRISGDQGGWAVVEANQAYASGIYDGADPEKVLEVVYRSSGKADKVSEHDKKFIRS